MARILNAVSQRFFSVEHLNLENEVRSQSPNEHSDVDRTDGIVVSVASRVSDCKESSLGMAVMAKPKQ